MEEVTLEREFFATQPFLKYWISLSKLPVYFHAHCAAEITFSVFL